jgi:hypothetical protein
MASPYRILGFLLFGALCLELGTGCKSGPAKVNITGKVVKNGEPLKVSDKGEIRVKFYSQNMEEETSRIRPAIYNASDGTFQVKDIPVGKYRITVEQIDPMPSNKNDKLQHAFDNKNSPIIRDVESNGQNIEIDLAKEKPGA